MKAEKECDVCNERFTGDDITKKMTSTTRLDEQISKGLCFGIDLIVDHCRTCDPSHLFTGKVKSQKLRIIENL